MSISNLGAVGYQPQVTSFTAKRYNGPEDFKPGLIMPENEEKKNKHTVLKTVVTLAVVVGAAVLLKKHGKSILNKIKGFFNKGAKAATNATNATNATSAANTAQAGKTIKVNTPAKPAAEVVRNIETSTANSSARKAVEQAIKDTPTKAQQAAYDESIRYVAPTAKQKAAIKANNAVAARETAIAHQIQNAASPESVKALEKAKQGMSEVNTSLNGLFESNGAKLTVKNGKIVKIQTPDGRAITKELNIAKYEHKHGIDLSKLTPASAPKAKAKIKIDTKKQQEIDAAWKEYTSKQNVPTTEQIFAQRNADAAKLKQEQVSQAWAEHSPKVETPKAEAPKTEQKLEDLIAQSEADATRIKQQRLQEVEEMIEKQKKEIDAALALKKQQMDEMWAAAGY